MGRGTLAGNAMPVSLVDTTFKDPVDGAIITVDSAHHEVHEGHSFIASHYSASVANNATLNMLVTTTSKTAHMVFKCVAGGDAVVTFHEGISTATNGTVLAMVNLNRDSVEVSSVTAHHTPTGIAGGSILETILLPGGTGPAASSGAEIRRDTEWLLKLNTKYLVRITNISGNNQPMSINIEYYTI